MGYFLINGLMFLLILIFGVVVWPEYFWKISFSIPIAFLLGGIIYQRLKLRIYVDDTSNKKT